MKSFGVGVVLLSAACFAVALVFTTWDCFTAPALAQHPRAVSVDVPQSSPAVAAEGIWFGVGPDNKALPLGTYRFIFVPNDPSLAVSVTTVATGSGPPPTTPTVPTGLSAKVAAALGKVTDQNKKATATALIAVYEEFVKSITDGQLTSPTSLASGTELITTVTTSGHASWSEFNSLVKTTMKESTSIQASKASLVTFAEELKKL